jgi:plasmid stabilization system protein ParE
MKLRLTPKAEEDLIEIYGYGARIFGVSQAERYYVDLEATLFLLADRPLLLANASNSHHLCASIFITATS